MALGNIALDLLGQARVLLTYAGELEGAGRTEDDLAYLRDEREFRNVQLVEQPRTATSASRWHGMLRVLGLPVELYAALVASHATRRSPAVAVKAVKEVDYHRDHASHWVLRLGDGTAECHAAHAGCARRASRPTSPSCSRTTR